MFPAQTYVARREALRKSLKSGIILMVGATDSPINYASNAYPFRQDSNFLYYFGINRSGWSGVIDIDQGTDCLYANEWTIDDLIWMGPQPSVREQAADSGIKSTYPLLDLATTINSAIKKGRKVHFLPPYRPQTVMTLADLLGIRPARVRDYYSRDLTRAVIAMREIKSPEEIAQIEDAAVTGYKMHTAAMRMARDASGTEADIAAEIERIALAAGGRTSFRSIVSQHGETLHNLSYSGRLTKGKLLLVDAGAENSAGYASDHTRTLPVGGQFSPRQREIYDIVLAANARGQELARPGVTYQSVHLEAAKVLAEGLVSLGLMRGQIDDIVDSGAIALFMPHGLGHQMGLDVHDMEDLGEKMVGYDDATTRSTQFGLGALRMGKRLSAGHVLTVEPGIYFIPALIGKWEREQIATAYINYSKLSSYFDFGGIRLEDNILITANGNRLVSRHRPPITPDEVEVFMNKE